MTDEPSTYGALHAGDCVRGPDGTVWGVSEIIREPTLIVTLVRGTQRATGYPAPGDPVAVVQRADVSVESWAAANLINGFGAVDLLGERWT